MDKYITFYCHTRENITINLNRPPENLEELIHDAFENYTYGTHPDFVDSDKLRFIDSLRNMLHRQDFAAFYAKASHEMLDYAIETGNSFDLEEFESSYELAEAAYEAGFKPLKYKDESFPERDIYKSHHTLCRIIAAVMAYPG